MTRIECSWAAYWRANDRGWQVFAQLLELWKRGEWDERLYQRYWAAARHVDRVRASLERRLTKAGGGGPCTAS